jgi:hypothetical protein
MFPEEETGALSWLMSVFSSSYFCTVVIRMLFSKPCERYILSSSLALLLLESKTDRCIWWQESVDCALRYEGWSTWIGLKSEEIFWMLVSSGAASQSACWVITLENALYVKTVWLESSDRTQPIDYRIDNEKKKKDCQIGVTSQNHWIADVSGIPKKAAPDP